MFHRSRARMCVPLMRLLKRAPISEPRYQCGLVSEAVRSETDTGCITTGGKGTHVREFQRGAVRLHILHHATEKEIHGAWLTTELAHHGYHISPGTLYPTLHRLEAEGLLISEQRIVDGRARRVYRATNAGKAALAEDRAALAELAREILGHDPQ
jgi:DNA-binding PadR family transcriptional regulator